MIMSQSRHFSSLFTVLIFICLVYTVSASSPSLHPDEVKALKDIASTLGVKHLNLSEDPCLTKTLVITQDVLKEGHNSTIRCDCHFNNNKTCHITHFILKTFSLPGRLPPELSKLQYLESIDLCLNYLHGSIPMEWASLPYLTSISVCANRLSGDIPKGLGKFINLTQLILEANQFSGIIPEELGNLVNLEGLVLSSNQLVGSVPETLGRLKNLTNLRFSDNHLNGSIPEFIGNLSKLKRLELYASGLREPIPDSIFRLENLVDLRISDTTAGLRQFPHIISKNLKYLVLRNLNLTGPIPTTIWGLPNLMTLDLSFNRLTGEIPADAAAAKFTYLTGNKLSGKIESGPFLTASTNIDLSYNNFTWSPSCRERDNVNTYESSRSKNRLTSLLPCSAISQCLSYIKSLHINCGGPDVTIENSRGSILYEGNYGLTGSATNNHGKNWGFSNTGDFMDDKLPEDAYSISSESPVSAKYPELYQTARRSPLSLAYFAFCFENGSYNVKLHFAEIQFSDEEPYARLAKRFFNIYVQGKLIWEDFNIREEANGTHKEVIKEVNTTVTDNTLEIRLYWAGKGTTIIPKRGNYGSLISAISVCPSSESECGVEVKTPPVTKEHKSRIYPLILVITALILSLAFLIVGAFYWKKCVRNADSGKRDHRTYEIECFLLGVRRFSDNRLNGSIPELMGTLAKLQRLELYATGLTEPIPDSIFQLENLFDLRISDTTLGQFPHITTKNLKYLVLRNMNLTGPIPTTIWDLPYLMTLDLSFNRLTGEIPADATAPKYTYLAGNMLSGKVESGPFLTASTNIDLSYNNFTWSPSCRERTNVNTYESSSSRNSLIRLLPCSAINQCKNYSRSLHINCGGPNVTIENSRGRFLYEGDNSGLTGSAMNYHGKKWGFSNTGDFMDDIITEDTYTVFSDSVVSAKYPELYQTARLSPLSLAYFAFCFENGSYNVKLHFAEIQFSDEEPYVRLAKRFFNIYVQGKLIWEDFNIREEANGTHKEVIKEVNTTVTDNTLEIRLYWAGKGTTIIPKRGHYGSLISAISVCPSSESECGAQVHHPLLVRKAHKPRIYPLILVITTLILSLAFLIVGAFYWKKCVRNEDSGKRGSFSLKQLKVATDNFDPLNKIGEGGFGSVYKGRLPDGTLIAVKKLSSKSCQGNKEFVNEIGMIACLQHPNLVKLYGCCCENNQLLLVYEYLENNCLADALFGRSGLKLEWGTRHKICVGIARGLAFLHEDSAVKIIHRDIKGTNVLLDKDLNSKISDFGLARLHEDEKSHITTKVAGTIGYMAPEYVMRGHLTEKADVYSFGVVAMEIVSGKSNANYTPDNECCIGLLDWVLNQYFPTRICVACLTRFLIFQFQAFVLQKKGAFSEILDPKLEGLYDVMEAERMIKVSLLCSNKSPTLRPTMSEVVKMLEGETEIEQIISDPGVYGDELRFKRSSEIGTSSLPSDYLVSIPLSCHL
ncbi:unnamed protein product [Brassica napus]|uniref:non-specific serine/threonine protein kinase n=1 Tax=Brassica napus TaxID=3708 RepID=A0A816YIK7_BRANA|nr:unnamed protein product [Brassica napus]